MTDQEEFDDIVSQYPDTLEEMIGRPYTEENMRHVLRLIKEQVKKEMDDIANTQPIAQEMHARFFRPITLDLSRLPNLKPLSTFDDEET